MEENEKYNDISGTDIIFTETLGDLLAKQGFFEKAMRVFKTVYLAKPSKPLKDKIDSIHTKLLAKNHNLIIDKKINYLKKLLSRIQKNNIFWQTM